MTKKLPKLTSEVTSTIHYYRLMSNHLGYRWLKGRYTVPIFASDSASEVVPGSQEPLTHF